MRILAIEDDPMLQQVLQRGLLSEGHSVAVVGTGAEGLLRLEAGDFDVLVLDLGLPDIDGLALARGLREQHDDIPILMLTARDGLDDRLQGFEVGADDYLVKPFALRELLARLVALGHRTSARGGYTRLTVGDLVLDRRANEVSRGGSAIHLAPREYAVLELLMDHVGRTLTREAIMRLAWDYSFDGGSNVVETSIKRLRRAIDHGRRDPLIHTVRGVGYKLKALERDEGAVESGS